MVAFGMKMSANADPYEGVQTLYIDKLEILIKEERP